MMRLFFGFAAIAFAAATAAFTTPQNSAGGLQDYYFEFNSAISPTEQNVEDESNWILTTDMTGCPSGTARACKIAVTAAHVNGTALKTTADIQATEVSGVAFVDGGELVDYANRSNP